MIGTKLVAAALALGIAGGGVAGTHDAQPVSTNSQEATETVEKQDPNEQAKLQAAASITQDEATKAVLDQYADGTVQQVELEDENGTVVYGVHVDARDGNSYDVKVDAQTGKVLKADSDNDNDAEEANDAENEAEDTQA